MKNFVKKLKFALLTICLLYFSNTIMVWEINNNIQKIIEINKEFYVDFNKKNINQRE